MKNLLFLTALLLFHDSQAVSIFGSNDYGPPKAELKSGEDAYITANKGIKVADGNNIYEGDMVMTEVSAHRLYGDQGAYKRGAQSKTLGRLWLGTPPIMPYEITSDLKGTAAVDAIKAAMGEIQQLTCVRFREKIDTDTDFVSFVASSGCWSYVGRIGGGQLISLGSSGCWYKKTAVHEIMHALGFLHEQSRPDRDDFVTVFYDKIPASVQNNFKKYDKSVIDSLGSPYDYKSVMHYQNQAFSIDGQDTIQKKGDPTFQLGQSTFTGGMTKSDTKQLNLLYSCPDTSISTTTTPSKTSSSTSTSSSSTSTKSSTTSTATASTLPTTTSSATPSSSSSSSSSSTTTTTTTPATTTTSATTPLSTAVPATTRRPPCNWRCLIAIILRRLKRRRRTWGRRRRSWSSRRRRRSGWGKKRDMAEKDENVITTEEEQKIKQLKRDQPTLINQILAELDHDSESKTENADIKSADVKSDVKKDVKTNGGRRIEDAKEYEDLWDVRDEEEDGNEDIDLKNVDAADKAEAKGMLVEILKNLKQI